ncbi:transposase [Nocardia tengchongensis]|uniref:transposase n=1 Tax=Nocardia tengchongensis TaxID=2055889 RepID=UPI003645FF1B
MLLELIPGGAKTFLSARQARELIAAITPSDAAARVRLRLVVELIEDLETIDRKTAPLDASSGDQQRHRLSRAGNRKINRVLHIMAIVQLRNRTPDRVYYDGRRASGKTSMEAVRALKRRLSNVIYTRMLADRRCREWAGPGGQSGTTLHSSATGSNPHTDPSDKPQPGPNKQANPTPTPTS